MKIIEKLHKTSPYAGFKPCAPLYGGWHGDRTIFGRLIEKVKPKVIIEVGTWLGQSAMTMARECKARGLQAEIVCVDTWLGAEEFWYDHADKERYEVLNLTHGYPQVYYQFLSNVVASEHDDIITPFPIASTSAWQWFLKNGIKADLIYIDGSHEQDNVELDIKNYLKILAPNGIMFGDDWEGPFPGVQLAVDKCKNEFGLRRKIDDGMFWILYR
jgi:hypothetical protein